MDYEEIDADTQVIEDKMSEEFYIDLDTFQEIVSRLLPLVDVGTSELTGTMFKGFADVKNKMWLVKTEVSNNEQLKCGNSNPPCAPNIKFGYLECTECDWSE